MQYRVKSNQFGGLDKELSTIELEAFMDEHDLEFEPNVHLYGLNETIKDQGDACLVNAADSDDQDVYGRVTIAEQ